jgi:IMP dehydrogenase
MRQTYSFDDVLLEPKFSDIDSRWSIDPGNDLDDTTHLKLPVISSPMDTITDGNMASSMAAAGGLGVVHRYNTLEDQASIVSNCLTSYCHMNIAAAVGVTGDFLDRAAALYESGAKIICIDVAHGHHSLVKNAMSAIRSSLGNDVHLMVGNVATLEAFDELASWGADSIRVGIGGGSICSTRLVTGHGIPTFQSVLDCARTSYDVKIIADGGFKTTGDMVKAYAAGADFVMIGSMLAGTKETPGEVFVGNSGKKYKVYRGMASAAAQNAWRGSSSTPEGVSTTVPYRGGVKSLLENIAGGIRSGLSYSGARSLEELRSKASFILQTGSGQVESNTHILWRHK